MRGIADTGFLVAFANKRDIHHAWAVELASHVTDPLLTCEAVMAETAFHLRDASLALRMIEDGLITISFRAEHELEHLMNLAKRFKDRAPDFADLCLVRMSELYPKHTLFTIDRDDFRVYRRNRREIIPICCPSSLTE